MPSTQNIQTALLALRKAIGKAKTKKSVLENVDNVASSVVLLNSSSPSSLVFDKLASVFRLPLVPLYSAYTGQSLHAASAILSLVLNNIRSCFMDGENKDIGCQSGWERVANSLLSGVIDYLEDNNDDKTKTSIAKTLYDPICSFFFSKNDTPGEINIGTTLRCTAYMLLSDSATLHHDNQNKLRDGKLIGARSLGLTISETRDFAVLETLLNLFAILLPSSSVPQERRSYIQDVFFNNGKEVIDLLDGQQTKEWDETATKVLDILASSDISFPQPFDVEEVVVGETKYPQPEVSDRLYIDRKAFFVNVRREDGLYEDLQIEYTTVKGIKFTSAGENLTLVNVNLKTPPKLGDQDLTARDERIDLLVEVKNNDIPRFKGALRHRNLSKIIAASITPRISVSGDLDLDADGPQWRVSDKSSSEKVEVVETFYGSDPPREKQHTAGLSDTFDKVPSNVAKSNVTLKAKNESSEGSEGVPAPNLKASIFGESDEELSETGGDEPEPIKAKPGLPRKNKPGTITEIIVLSDNESVKELDQTSRALKATKKRLQKRAGSRNDATTDEVHVVSPPLSEAEPLENASLKVVPARDKEASEVHSVKGRVADTAATTRKGISTGRARRVAATAASKKLADVFPSSEDALSAEKDRDPSLAARAYRSKVNEARLPEPVNVTKRSASPDAIVAPRASSPTSKVSKMKAKNATAKNKPAKSGEKRASDKTLVADEEASSRKKPRIDVTNVGEGREQVSAHSAQKYGTRGRKAKARTQQEGTTGNGQRLVKDSSETATQDKRTLGHSSKTTPSANPGPKKETSQDESGVTSPIQVENKKKSQISPRIPLRILPHSSNVVQNKPEPTDHTSSMKSPSGRKLDAKRASGITRKRNTENASIPPLEDVLLKGIPVKDSRVGQKASEMNDENSNGPETNLDFGAAEGLPAAHITDSDKVFSTLEDITVDINNHKADHDVEPRTPLPKKLTDGTPTRNLPLAKPSRNTLDLDTEFPDLTDEDIREVLENLRERRSKKQREHGNTARQRASVISAPITEKGQESSSEDVEAPTLREIHSRNKVKFDEKLRYKSVSLESLPVQEHSKDVFLGTKGQKRRHVESESGSRGAIRGQQKGQETKNKKDPGMQEIIKVLDEIQNAVVSNIENKSRTVRSDIRIARHRLIHEAVADLHEMREESIGHYNNLLALENEYANISRKLNAGFENVANVNADICRFVQQNLSVHDRGSLPKKMARSLFASAIPESFRKFI